MHLHWIIVLLFAPYLLPGASGAPPVYVGNELELRAHYLANIRKIYLSYLHTEMLPRGSVTQLNMYIHDHFSLHSLSEEEMRCIRIHIYENDPPKSPVYMIRWQDRVCTDVTNQQLDVQVNPPITVQDNYYFGWTIEAHSESPVTMDDIPNVKTLYRFGAEPVDTAPVYFPRSSIHGRTWSVGVTVEGASNTGMLTTNLGSTSASSSAIAYIGHELKLRTNYLANRVDTYLSYLHTEMLPHGIVRQFQMYIHNIFQYSATKEMRCIRIHIYENYPPNSPVYKMRWQDRVCTDVTDQQLLVPVNPPMLVADNFYFGWTIEAQSEAPLTFDQVSNGQTLYRVGSDPVETSVIYFPRTSVHDRTWSIGVIVELVFEETTPIATTEETTSIATVADETTVPTALPVYVGNELRLRSNFMVSGATYCYSYLHTDMLPQGKLTDFQMYIHSHFNLHSSQADHCFFINVFENDPPKSPVYFLRWQDRVCTDAAGEVLDVPVSPAVLVGANYYFGWTVEPKSEAPLSYDRVSNVKTLYRIGRKLAWNEAVYFMIPRHEEWSIGVVVNTM